MPLLKTDFEISPSITQRKIHNLSARTRGSFYVIVDVYVRNFWRKYFFWYRIYTLDFFKPRTQSHSLVFFEKKKSSVRLLSQPSWGGGSRFPNFSASFTFLPSLFSSSSSFPFLLDILREIILLTCFSLHRSMASFFSDSSYYPSSSHHCRLMPVALLQKILNWFLMFSFLYLNPTTSLSRSLFTIKGTETIRKSSSHFW